MNNEELKGIVQRMLDAGESEENIKLVIEKYKTDNVEKTEGATATDAAVVPQTTDTDSASEDTSLELPQVKAEDTEIQEKAAIRRLNKKFGGLGFTFEETGWDVFGRDAVIIKSPDYEEDENGNVISGEKKKFQFEKKWYDLGISSEKEAQEINDFIKANANSNKDIDANSYANAWSKANTADIEFKNEDGTTKTLQDLTADEMDQHALTTLKSINENTNLEPIMNTIKDGMASFENDLVKEIQGKYDLSTESGINAAQAEFEKLYSAEFEKRFSENEDLAKILNSNEEAVRSRFKGLITDKSRKELEDELLEESATGRLVKNFPILNSTVRGIFGTAAVKFPKSEAEEDALNLSKKVEDVAEELRELEGRDPNETMSISEVIVGLPEDLRPKQNTTVAERIELLNKRKLYYREQTTQELAKAKEYQEKLEKMIHPTIFGKDITDPDLTLEEYKRMVGDQVVQMVGAMATFGGSTLMQESGAAFTEITTTKAMQKLFPGESKEEQYKKFNALDQEEQFNAILDIVESGEGNLDTATSVGIVNAGLDLVSNVIVVGKATKFIPKDLWRKLLGGKFKSFVKGGWKQLGKDASVASFSEFLTETAQEGVSMVGVGVSTGDFGTAKENIKRFAEAGGQALLVTGPLVTGGKATTTVVSEIRARVSQIKDPNATRTWINKAKEQIDADLKANKISKDQRDEYFTELEAAEQTINNTKFKNLEGKQKEKVIKNLVEQDQNTKEIQKLEEQIKNDKEESAGVIGEETYNIMDEINIKKLKEKNKELKSKNVKEVLKHDYKENGSLLAQWVNNKNEGLFKDKEVITFKTAKEAENYIDKNNIKIPEVQKQRLLNGEVNGTNLGNLAIIIDDNIIKNIDGGDWSSSNVVHHEVLHYILDGFDVKELDSFIAGAKREMMASKDPKMIQTWDLLNEKYSVYENNAKISIQKIKNKRLSKEQETKEIDNVNKILKEEFMTSLSDALSFMKSADINIDNGGILASLGEKLQNLFNKNTNSGIDFSALDAENTLTFIQKYNDFNGKGPKYQGLKIKGGTDAQDTPVKESISLDTGVGDLSQRIDALTRGAKTKSEFQSPDGAFGEIYKGIIDGSFDRVFGEGVSREQREIMREELANRLLNFDPAKTPELSKWMYGGKGKAGNITYSGLVAKKELFEKGEKAKKEVRGDTVTETGKTIFEGIADKPTETKAPTKRQDKAREIKTLKDITINNKEVISKSVEDKILKLIEENPTNLIEQLETIISKDITKEIKAQMGKISKKGGEVVVSEEYKAYHALNYQNHIDALDVNTIKKNYNKLFTIKQIGREKDKKVDPKTGKVTYPGKGIYEIKTTKAEWTKYFTEGGYTTLLARQKQLAEIVAKDLTRSFVDQYIAENSNNLNEVIEAELRNWSNSLDKQKGEVLSFDSIKFSAVVRNMRPLELKVFYNNLPALGDMLKTVNVKDEKAVTEAVYNIYNEYYSSGKLNKVAESLYKIVSRYSAIEQRHTNLKTQPEETLNEYLYNNVKAAELDVNLAKFLELKDDAGKYIQLSNSFDNINRINTARAEIVTLGNKLISKYGKAKALMMLVHASGMYATSSKISRGNFVIKDGVVVAVTPKDIGKESFGSQRYQVFESKKDFVDNVIIKVFGKDAINTTNSGGLSKFQTIEGKKIDISLLAEKSKEAMKDRDFAARKAQAKLSEQFVRDMAQHYKDQIKDGNLDKEDFAILMMSMASNMQSPLKRAANLKYIFKNKQGKKYNGGLRYEHMIPTNYMVMKLTDAYMNDGNVDLDALFDQYTVAVIPETMDNILEEMGLVHVMPVGYLDGANSTQRYYNMSTYGHPDLYAIESIDPKDKGKTYGEKVANIKFSESVSKGNQSLAKAVNNSRTIKEPKGITVLDFDDTLATTESLVKYTTPDGKTGTLNAEQFASTYQDLQDKGYVFDFSDFNKVVKGKLAPLFNKAMKLQSKFGPKNMFVLTARPPQAQQAIFDFLKANGLNIPLENITGLGNSTAEAKALWIADKVADGYNDFYFADDALQNVQAVKNMLDQFDVKSKVQQAKVKLSETMNSDFNKILEEVTGIESEKRFSAIKARKRGSSKGKFRFFIPPSHEDFVGLLYNFMGKGREGDKHRDFFEQNLVRPLNRAYRELNAATQSIANDYKSLNKRFPGVKKKLTKKTPDGDFTYQDAVRVYLWNKHGYDIEGLSKADQQALVEIVQKDMDLQVYADLLNKISKQEGYVKPGKGWEAGDIRTDLADATGGINREQFFAEFFENADIIFSQENLNKIEAAYGAEVVSAIKDILHRTKTGRNRPSGQNKLVNSFLNYLNGSVAATMFFNIRSMVLQQMSMVNFINFGDNNIYAAAKAFANQKQYWTDWATIFNSDFMKQRRGGIMTDVNGAELAASIKGASNKPRALLAKLLQMGFLPTQIGDNVAIATGGAAYYRNKINAYLKQGFTKKEAEAKAWTDFTVLAESTQQSARPDMVSQQQASALGKVILAFQNVTSQFNRLGKKAFSDIYNRRITPEYRNSKNAQLKSDMSNLSRIAYYLAIQNLIFYSLQSALFAALFDDDEDDEKWLKKKERAINGSIDSVLRGTGVWGAVVSTVKNMIFKWLEQRDKKYNPDESAVLMEMLNVSPPLGIKARKLVNAEKTLNYNEKAIKEMDTLDIDNPVWSAVTSYIEAITNAPLNRMYNKTQNVRESLSNQYDALTRALLFAGWSKWNLGFEDEKKDKKEVKKPKKKKVKFKKKSKNY